MGMGFLLAIQGAVSQGVLWGIMTLGVYLTFRILDIADLTVDGSFATGGALSAILIVKGINPLFSLLCSFIAGAVCGLITGVMNTKLKIHILLASILTQIALYSVNIRIMGRPNIPLLGVKTIMTGIHDTFAISITASSLVVGATFVVVLVVVLYLFFGTEIGCALRATGNNEYMVRALGVNTNTMKVAGLALGNGLVALSGGLVAQSQGYADVQMGTGTIVIGLASIIIGEVIFGKHFGFWYTLISVILGSILYRIVIALVLQMGLRSTDLKLLTALVVAIALAVPVFKGKLFCRRHSLSARVEENTRHSNVIKKHAVRNVETLGENKNC